MIFYSNPLHLYGWTMNVKTNKNFCEILKYTLHSIFIDARVDAATTMRYESKPKTLQKYPFDLMVIAYCFYWTTLTRPDSSYSSQRPLSFFYIQFGLLSFRPGPSSSSSSSQKLNILWNFTTIVSPLWVDECVTSLTFSIFPIKYSMTFIGFYVYECPFVPP